jgi:selenocysteine lyase/cysteine desulfurase
MIPSSPIAAHPRALARTLRRSLLPGERFYEGARSAPLALRGADAHVPLAGGHLVRAVHADNAATTLGLEGAHAAVEALWAHYGSAHRGAGYASAVTSELVEAARASVGAFVGARSDEEVVFTRNTTDAIALLAHALPDDADVVSFAFEHHANLLPWRRFRGHRLLPVVRTQHDLLARAEESLSACTARVRLLAVTGASNVTGELLPIDALADLAHRHGARLFVDGAQLAPHRAISLDAQRIDYLALSGHKLYAPFGAGALVGRRDWLDEAAPYLLGGGAARTVDDFGATWHEGPARHEAGTPNVPGIVAFAAACEALEEVGFDRLRAHEDELRGALDHALASLPHVTPLRIFHLPTARTPCAAFRVAGAAPGLVAAALAAEHGVSLRDGAFCAQPLLRALVPGAEGDGCGSAPSAVRASFGGGSRLADVERLRCALEHLATHGASERYRVVDGRFILAHDGRPRPRLLRSQRERGPALNV